MTKEEGINQVYGGGRHIVILGAGASIASTFRNAELKGKRLPSMDNFIEVVGLQELVEQIPDNLREANFESLYSNLYNDNPKSPIIQKIENRIQIYFGNMRLPEEPTIYDYLILSLRSKDLIATFNWDPFLYQAYVRNRRLTKDLPHLSFLHGNVAIGYSKEDKRCGAVGYQMRLDGGLMEPTKLLYPIESKDYTDDEFISIEWDRVQYWLRKESGSVRVTIFGYGAPVSDVGAVRLLNQAWGTSDERDVEQFEMIDVASNEELKRRWEGFIHGSHYNITNNYFNSCLALNPRRTSESYFNAYKALSPDELFRESNPVPQDFNTLEELWSWHKPLLEAEENSLLKEGG